MNLEIDLIKVKTSRNRHIGAKGKRKYTSKSFLTSALDGVSGQPHAPGRALPPGKNPRYPLDRKEAGWVSRAGLDTDAREKILCLCRESNPARPVCCQTLYLLSYPDRTNSIKFNNLKHALIRTYSDLDTVL
jgi:hypothetical protein